MQCSELLPLREYDRSLDKIGSSSMIGFGFLDLCLFDAFRFFNGLRIDGNLFEFLYFGDIGAENVVVFMKAPVLCLRCSSLID